MTSYHDRVSETQEGGREKRERIWRIMEFFAINRFFICFQHKAKSEKKLTRRRKKEVKSEYISIFLCTTIRYHKS